MTQKSEEFIRSVHTMQQALEGAAGWNPFAAFGGDDNCSTFPDNTRCGTDTLGGLIQIQVERVAAVGGNNHIIRLIHALHRRGANELAARFVALEQMTGKHAGNITVVVERNVQQETPSNAQRYIPHLLPRRVALRDAKS